TRAPARQVVARGQYRLRTHTGGGHFDEIGSEYLYCQRCVRPKKYGTGARGIIVDACMEARDARTSASICCGKTLRVFNGHARIRALLAVGTVCNYVVDPRFVRPRVPIRPPNGGRSNTLFSMLTCQFLFWSSIVNGGN